MQRGKYYCTECGWAAKTGCPVHPASSVSMGPIWRPGKKGKRTRLWDDRVWGRRADAHRITGASKARYYGGPRPAPDLIVRLGGRDRLRKQTGAGWLGVADPVTFAIYERAVRRKIRRHR